MLVVKSWLSNYFSKPISDQALVEALTKAGIEVEGVEKTGDLDPKIIVTEITKLSKHPNADRLSLITLNDGSQSIKIVTGAPNLEKGMKVAFAPVGAELPDGTVIKVANFRGIESPGMALSAQELGLGQDHSGLLALAPDLAVGTPLRKAFPAETVIDIKTAANRSDLQSYIGIVREVSAHLGLPLVNVPDLPAADFGQPASHFDNQIKHLVPRYLLAKVNLPKAVASPDWLVRRLELSGIRPLGLVVDITNYVMLETGQPLHAFDGTKTSGQIKIRLAKAGEPLTTLDGKARKLAKTDIVIADTKKVIGVGGVMGGANSEVDDKTTTILVEAANFDGVTVRKTAVALGTRTEASARFERGLPVQLAPLGLAVALALLKDLADAKVEWVEDELNIWPWIQHIGVKTAHLSQLAGVKLTNNQVVSHLQSLGFAAEAFDITQEAKKHLGKPYKFGASFKTDGINAFDCSYLSDYIYSLIGMQIGHTAEQQFNQGQPVEIDQLKAGDLVFCGREAIKDEHDELPHKHVGLYIGGGKIIEANSRPHHDVNGAKDPKAQQVSEETVQTITANSDFKGARRFAADLKGYIAVTTPYWRPDVKIAEDVFEEVIKLVGLSKVPMTLPEWRLSDVQADTEWPNIWQIRSLLVGIGLSEVITYPFVSEDELKQLGFDPSTHLTIANPRSVEQRYLRQSLLPGLLSAIASNSLLKTDFGWFEIDRVFLPVKGQELPHEDYRLAVIVQTSSEAYSQAKNALDNLASSLQIDFNLAAATSPDYLVASRSMAVKIGSKTIGVIGQVEPKLTKARKIHGQVGYIELGVDQLLAGLSPRPIKPVGKYQTISRDLTAILPQSVSWQMVKSALDSIESVQVDYKGDYYGPQVGANKRALTIEISIQPDRPHYTDSDANRQVAAITKLLISQFKAEIS